MTTYEVDKKILEGLDVNIQQNDEDVTIQNPLPTDGDSVYVKDIDTTYSDNGNFSGYVTDYFDSLKTINNNVTANNPKIIKIWFNRTVYSHSIGIGCDDLDSGFGTDVTVKLLGSGEQVRYTKQFTGINKNSYLLEFGAKAFNGFILEFNTASIVSLSNITIQKSVEGNVTLHGKDPNGEIQDVQVTEDGYLAIEDSSSGLSIAEGKVSGKSFIHKFGAAPDFDTGDGFVTVWDGAEDGQPWELMRYVYSTTDDIDSVSSSDNGDTQDIEVQGLDIDYELTVQTVTLTGQARVALPTPLIRVFRIKNVNSIDFAGHVACYVNTSLTGGIPTDNTKLRAVVHQDNNQSEMAVFTIPAGKTGYMRDWYASTAGAKRDSSHTIKLVARKLGGVFQLKHTSNIDVNGTSYIKHEYTEPEVFIEKTDIEIRMNTNQDQAGVASGFDIVLVDN